MQVYRRAGSAVFYVNGFGKLCCIANVLTPLGIRSEDVDVDHSAAINERLSRGSQAVSALIDACGFSEALCSMLRIGPVRLHSAAGAGKHSTAVGSLSKLDMQLVGTVSFDVTAAIFSVVDVFQHVDFVDRTTGS